MNKWEEIANELGTSHVDWFLSAIRPLLIEHFVHGFKHGMSLEAKDILAEITQPAVEPDAEKRAG